MSIESNIIAERSSQPKITNLYYAPVINQNVARLKIPVDDICRLQVMQGAENLMHDCLHMDTPQNIFFDPTCDGN